FRAPRRVLRGCRGPKESAQRCGHNGPLRRIPGRRAPAGCRRKEPCLPSETRPTQLHDGEPYRSPLSLGGTFVLRRRGEEFPVSQENAMNAGVAECIDMAMMARGKAASGLSPAGERFWRRMEERWLLLAKTYRETEKLRDAWLRAPAGKPPLDR